ncbi:MAG: glycosyltransferase family 4 protein [Candidatus Poribacteria bacterium]|nr:glycosyltransferase family 4 protein [Candidatus Poribacteria bacterium]
MIRFPRTLQQIHTFEKDGVWYVANLQTGDVLQIDSLTADILALCSTHDNAGILKKLGHKYSEGQILESLKALGDNIETLLFEPEQTPILTTEDGKLRIFIPHGFMKYKEILSPTTNVGIYNLLTALAKYAEVFVEIDNDDTTKKQREQLIALGIQFASDIFESTDAIRYAANRFIVDGCDGILALSPHPYEELNYFRHNAIPVVSRIYSDRELREATINKLLSHQALCRDFDSVCADTPWIADELNWLMRTQTDNLRYDSSRMEDVCTIPNGVDTNVYSPQDRQQAREAVASIVGETSILDSPFVGILNGFHPQNSIGMITELANLHKNVVFIVLDSILSQDRYQRLRNVFYIDIQQPEDTVALPWIYSACEFIIFPTVIGTPFSMVLEAFACGVPGLALTSTALTDELTAATLSVPLTRDETTGKFVVPTAIISEQINAFLGNPEARETLSTKARQIAETYSWDKTARRFVTLFTELNAKKAENVTPKYADVAFAPYYNKTQNTIKIGATQLEGLFKHRVEEGLAQILLSTHTPEEVRTVLRHILQDTEKADKVLATLLP